MIRHKSLHIKIPDARPFDREENWFESFLGNFVVPIIETTQLKRYWFSRYRDDNLGKHARFRFYTNSYTKLETRIKELLDEFNLIKLNDEENYNTDNDLGSIRFLGENMNNQDKSERANLIYDFLYATSRLYIHTLSHKDNNGYFYREINNKTSNNPKNDSLESVHHLFCNLTQVPLHVYVVEKDGKQTIVSDLHRKLLYSDWKPIGKVPISF